MSESDADSIAWPLVLAVVVTHNGGRWLPGCLKSLAMQTYPALEVVVVDAASEQPESVRKLVSRLLPTASLLRIERNVGFGAAANRALELSPDARSAEFYLFLHDDVALDRDCVGLLVAAGLETNAGVVGGKGLSWDEPEVLLEVGMSADEFGYPVSGLEEREIDQGQHDTRREVLFVTSACILVSRETVERCGSWDVGYVLFGEDLDLCIRARLCGFPVVVTPAATFYHAVAMATGRREGAPKDPVRYFTRRNRLRTIAKSASATRVLLVIALYTGLLSAEVVLLAALRRFDEIPPYFKAYAWFVRSLPDVARRRRAVQRRRTVPDRRVRRYQVRELPRARIFLERRLMQWGAETMRFGHKTFSMFTPSALAARLGRWARSPAVVATALIVLATLVAARHALFGPTMGAGTLWPFPTATHTLLTDYLAGWREIGLGTSGAPPPSLPVMWLVDIVAFGNAALAQKLLVGGLMLAGLIGVFRFMRKRTAFVPAQLVALGVYALAPVLRLGLVTGDLGALTVYGFAPYLLEAGLRVLGPVPGSGRGPRPGTHAARPPVVLTGDAMGRQVARLALLSALVIAVAPGAFVVLGVLWLILGFHAIVGARIAHAGRRPAGWPARRNALGELTGAGTPASPGAMLADEIPVRLGCLLASLAAAVVLLLPWSLPALRSTGAVLGPLFAGAGGGASYHPLWTSLGFAHSLLLAPRVPAIAGVLTVGAVAGAMLVASTPRRRESRLLALVILVFGAWAGFVTKGWLPAPVASPGLWLAVPALALAACAGYLFAALAEDITRHIAGWRQPIGVLTVIVVGVGAVIGWVPTLLSWSPAPSSAVAGTGVSSDVDVLAALKGAATSDQQFRVLWLGASFVSPDQAGLGRPQGTVPYLVTGPQGLSMLDASRPGAGAAGGWLSGVVGDLVGDRTHLAANQLATAGIGYLVIRHADLQVAPAVLRQQGFELTQEISGLDIYQNLDALPLAGPVPSGLTAAIGGGAGSLALLLADWNASTPFRRVSLGAFSGSVAGDTGGAGTVLVSEAYSGSWRAMLGSQVLPHVKAFGWANGFTVPAGATGTIQVDYRGEWPRLALVILELLVVALALAMATVPRGLLAGGGEHSVGAPAADEALKPPPGPLARAAATPALPARTRRRVDVAESARQERAAQQAAAQEAMEAREHAFREAQEARRARRGRSEGQGGPGGGPPAGIGHRGVRQPSSLGAAPGAGRTPPGPSPRHDPGDPDDPGGPGGHGAPGGPGGHGAPGGPADHGPPGAPGAPWGRRED